MMTRETITVGRQRFRVGPWQADDGVAHLSTPPSGSRPTTDDIAGVIEQVRLRGYRSVLTSALEEPEIGPFVALGFTEHDRLRVLEHDLQQLDRFDRSPAGVHLRRARRGDRTPSLAVDRAAFPAFWRLDEQGLADAEMATPSCRFRVASRDGRLLGYAVTGRGGHTGFLQRLATDPAWQQQGIGTALVGDALRWCARRHCDRVYVNTQVGNAGALSLYARLGFRRTGNDLVVLAWAQS